MAFVVLVVGIIVHAWGCACCLWFRSYSVTSWSEVFL